MLWADTSSAQAQPQPFNVYVNVDECGGVEPVHDAEVVIEFDNGKRWEMATDENGEVHEIVVPGPFKKWRVGVNGLWHPWNTLWWAEVYHESCWLHMPAIIK